QGNQRRQGGYVPRGGYTPRGRGGYNPNYRGNGQRRGNYHGRGGFQNRRVEVPESDFDFESSNSKLNKDDLAREFAKLNVHVAGSSDAAPSESVASTASAAVAVEADESAYQPKSSFFDNISCETKERIEMQDQGMSHEERRSRVHAERQQNYETFGQVSAEQNRFRYNRNHQGGRGYYQNNWRGGRGGRGHHRGGYNPNYRGNNNNNYRNQGAGRGYYQHQQGQDQGDNTGAESSIKA
ncbi:hypothetical protein IWW50_005261, partial [Coemansia erecta]